MRSNSCCNHAFSTFHNTRSSFSFFLPGESRYPGYMTFSSPTPTQVRELLYAFFQDIALIPLLPCPLQIMFWWNPPIRGEDKGVLGAYTFFYRGSRNNRSSSGTFCFCSGLRSSLTEKGFVWALLSNHWNSRIFWKHANKLLVSSSLRGKMPASARESRKILKERYGPSVFRSGLFPKSSAPNPLRKNVPSGPAILVFAPVPASIHGEEALGFFSI